MSVRIPQQQTRPGTGARLRRLAVAVAAVITVLIASAVIVPAASADVIPGGGGTVQAPAQAAVTAGGMPGWQITLIALAAAQRMTLSTTSSTPHIERLWRASAPSAGDYCGFTTFHAVVSPVIP